MNVLPPNTVSPMDEPRTPREEDRIYFRRLVDGRLIEGVSEPLPLWGNLKLSLDVVSRAACPMHPLVGGRKVCPCVTEIIGERHGPTNLETQQFAQFIIALIFGTTTSITDKTNNPHAIANATATSAPTILLGTGQMNAAVTDIALQTPVAGTSGGVGVSPTVGAYAANGTTSGGFTVSVVITNSSGASVNYGESVIQITCGGNSYTLAHDVWGPLPGVNGGTITITYTLIFQ